jgi:hypothetical protein
MATVTRRPVHVVWTGASFVPQGPDMRHCQHFFGAGEILIIDPEQERDMNSHRHYFAQLHEAWRNLPERLEKKYPTEDIFRKKLLIEAGFFHLDEIVCDTERDAAVVAAFMAPLDPSTIIRVRGPVIMKYTAMSQSVAAMGRSEFQKSKWAVLDLAASLIEVTPKQLEKHTGKSA